MFKYLLFDFSLDFYYIGEASIKKYFTQVFNFFLFIQQIVKWLSNLYIYIYTYIYYIYIYI